MTEEITNSLLSKVLEWLPEQWHEFSKNSSTLLNIILNEVMSDRDVRITGSAGAARPECALIAAIHKARQQQDGKRFVTIVVCPSRESEDIMTKLAESLCKNTDLVVRPTALMRTTTIVAHAFQTPADIVITSLRGLEKIRRTDAVKPEQIRTVIIDDMEWFETAGELADLEAYVEALPAARQLIGITKQGDIDERLIDLLHAPIVCRAPDLEKMSRKVKERLIIAPEDNWGEVMVELAENAPVLYIAESPTDAKRVIGRLKSAGYDPKRVTVQQTDTARKTLILKFSGNLVPHVVISSPMLSDVQKGSVPKIVHTEVPGSARSYLNHLSYLADEGEIVTVTTPEDLPKLEAMLLSAEKKLKVENPFKVEKMPASVGQIVSRQKLTVRTDFNKDAEPDVKTEVKVDAEVTTESTAPTELFEEQPEKRPYKRKNPKFSKPKYAKKDKFQRKPRRDEEGESVPTETGEFSDETSEGTTEKKYFKKRYPPFKKRYEKRPYRERREDMPAEDSERAETMPPVNTLEDGNTSLDGAPVTDRHEGNNGERTWRPKTKYNRFRKPYNKDRRQQKVEGEESQKTAPAPDHEVSDEQTGDEGYARPKKFTKYPQKKRPYQPKPKKSQQRPRDDWYDDDDNFGNSIHYQPRRQNLRNLRSDEPLHWEPSDPFHPSSQALSLPQMMPDENGFRPSRPRNDRKGNYNRPHKPGFKKYRGSGEN